MSEIEKHKSAIQSLCNLYGVKSLYVFGSVLTSRFSQSSDIDFVVRFGDVSSEDYADNYFGLKAALESLLKRPIDLLEEQALKNPYLISSINTSKKLLYG